jgi:hypothetical protein
VKDIDAHPVHPKKLDISSILVTEIVKKIGHNVLFFYYRKEILRGNKG